MIDNMNSYFVAEKQESVIFIAVGLLALAISVWLWVNGHRLKSMAYPLFESPRVSRRPVGLSYSVVAV